MSDIYIIGLSTFREQILFCCKRHGEVIPWRVQVDQLLSACLNEVLYNTFGEVDRRVLNLNLEPGTKKDLKVVISTDIKNAIIQNLTAICKCLITVRSCTYVIEEDNAILKFNTKDRAVTYGHEMSALKADLYFREAIENGDYISERERRRYSAH